MRARSPRKMHCTPYRHFGLNLPHGHDSHSSLSHGMSHTQGVGHFNMSSHNNALNPADEMMEISSNIPQV